MNDYERKQADRRDRYEDRAVKAATQSDALYSAARKRGEAIPFGQPILIGHHSERRDRNFRAGINRMHEKSFELSDKAKYYEQKAASVGTGGISSDDPDALVKLRAELAECEANQDRMKAANKAIRTGKTPDKQVPALVTLGFSEADAQSLIKGDFCGRVGFAGYQLSNNNANMTRIKKRIQELEVRRSREAVEVETEGYKYREDVEENRVMFVFDGKPAPEIRDLLKRNAFKWSPSRGAWVRHLTGSGIYAGQVVREGLAKLQAE
ncbi:DUF3560 domain-containing protein [Pseudomonas sp. P5_152]|uniref:DUF3560 domain-containing protein n=1 Tax=Pseudomonas sp. P5_152 TaxID=3043442 RepID=UPI002A36BABB|nr:DUF3560 domain-containing protein [Pseudomonas sp. P5_152]MDX9668611.1 DUF3560 domain-containing protein [Pseudomonas sp. P5_152]